MRVLSIDDFLHGVLPSSKAFQAALSSFEEQAILPYIGRGIFGAFCYGSARRGDCTPASDCDYFAVLTEEKNMRAVLAEESKRVAIQFGVPVQIRTVDLDVAKAGLHGINLSFRQHLLHVASQGHFGENPVDALHYAAGIDAQVMFHRDLVQSLEAYLRKIDNEYVESHESDTAYHRFLTTILDKPFHVLRVALQHQFGTVNPRAVFPFADTKSSLMSTYQSFAEPALCDAIDKIKDVSDAYVTLLVQKREDQIGVSTERFKVLYKELLQEIEACYPVARYFIKASLIQVAATPSHPPQN